MAVTDHVVYGLYHPMSPRIIRYVGSSRADKLNARLEQHRAGKVKTTAKMSVKSGVPLAYMRARVLGRWTTGNSIENRVLRLARLFGMAKWNFPYALSSSDNRRGAIAANASMTAEQKSANGSKGGRKSLESGHIVALGRKNVESARIQGRKNAEKPGYMATIGRKGGRKVSEKLGHMAKIGQRGGLTGGRKGGRKGGRDAVESGQLAAARPKAHHVRWHVNRNIVNPDCTLCTLNKEAS